MPRYEDADSPSSNKTSIDCAPDNLQEEADMDRAAGRPSVGTRGGRPITSQPK